MKNKIGEFFYGRNLKLSGLLVLGVFVFVGLGCFGGGRKSSTPPPAAYLGDWQGQDGSTLSIRGDGTGDYHAGSTKVEGGTAEVDEGKRTVSITFFGIGKTLKIDQPPAGNQMTLDGVMYRRSGGFSDTTTTNTSTSNSSFPPAPPTPTNKSPFGTNSAPTDNTSQSGLPSDVEIETLIKSTVSDFASGVDEGDFSSFRLNASKDFQATLSAAQVNSQFQVFIDQKSSLLPSLRQVDGTSADYSEPPHLRTEKGYTILVANGSFPTTRPVVFQTEYELERGRWKLLTFRIKM